MGFRRRTTTGLAVGAALLLVASCASGSGSDQGADGDPRTRLSLADYALTPADLPDGWQAYPSSTEPVAEGETPPTIDSASDAGVCGMRNPADVSDPTDRVQVGYSKRTGGPFLYETIATYPSEQAARKAFRLATDGFDTCLATGATQDPPTVATELAVDELGDQRAAIGLQTTSPEKSAMGQGSMSAGAQGTSFYVQCGFSHRSEADPIVHPGGAATDDADHPDEHGGHGTAAPHSHEFFGNTGTDGASTATSLLGGATSCNDDGDRSAYWAPTLLRGDEPVTPEHVRAWYSLPFGADADSLTALPAGLQMIAGDVDATSAQSTGVAGWRCGDELGPLVAAPPSGCSSSQPLTLQLRFPVCWDGEHLSSEDHRSHVAYRADGSCPASHPVLLPQLELVIDYGDIPDPAGLRLASGDLTGIHGEVMAAWTDGSLDALVRRCLGTDARCEEGEGPSQQRAYAQAVAVRQGRTLVLFATANFEPLDLEFTERMTSLALERLP